MDDSQTLLYARIRRHCETQRWYGPDGGLEKDRATRDANGILHIQPITHDARVSFEFPPATPEQLRITEEQLGYPLPSSLRRLYAEVANGGFGPGNGITGGYGGYWYGWDDLYTTNDQPWSPPWPCRLVDLTDYAEQHGPSEDEMTLPSETWPDHFLHLCYWGCGTSSFLDASTDRVYVVIDITARAVSLVLDAPTLAEWLEVWVTGARPHWWGPPASADNDYF